MDRQSLEDTVVSSRECCSFGYIYQQLFCTYRCLQNFALIHCNAIVKIPRDVLLLQYFVVYISSMLCQTRRLRWHARAGTRLALCRGSCESSPHHRFVPLPLPSNTNKTPANRSFKASRALHWA